MRQIISAAVAAVALSLVLATSALAMDCANASKNQAAGVQLVFGGSGIVWISNGLQHRIDQGLVDPSTGEGFHGLVGIDFDGDGEADVSTWAGVGPDGTEIPDNAQENGPACRGLTSIFVYLTTCVEA